MPKIHADCVRITLEFEGVRTEDDCPDECGDTDCCDDEKDCHDECGPATGTPRGCAEKPQPPAPGDIVRLKSGGPPMTVGKVEGDRVSCCWASNDGVLDESTFAAAALRVLSRA